ncbi:hypothetical protein [Paucisalibacillus globulus]|jgi:hypothetical protein|uniref:hypothetical protein n=1 Tax=Paucisalibacillus globulus TaxID=351095 RepID=UPI00040D5684|nr:hypothetical protein [Paucisalibacillus globulus]
METALFFLLALGYICLFIWGLILSKNRGLFKLTNVLLLVILGLIYDNAIIAFGKFIGKGTVLEWLSYGRFWLHALFTPTLILFAWSVCFRTDLPWAKHAFSKVLAYLLTIGLILFELFVSIRGLKLEAVWKNGLLTYESVGSTNPFMVIVITLLLGIVGSILMVKFRFFWLLSGTVVMVLGSVLANWISFPIMNVLEFLFIVSLLLTKKFILQFKGTGL